jgi:hypothetical protein
MSSKKMGAKQPLVSFISNLPMHELSQLYETLEVAHNVLIYESTDEKLLMDQFMTTLWVAARGERI